mmetsp:Transcript_16220/g.63248  ORF Transcript_16220/g.63248 Transcript_16220/m.63248 type:complete len:289 (-) Transcript_16220:974-1840(-)
MLADGAVEQAGLLLCLLEHVAVAAHVRRADLLLGARALADRRQVCLHLRAQMGLLQVEAHVVVRLHQRHSQARGAEAVLPVLDHILACENRLDMRSYRRVRPDAVAVHELDELLLEQQAGGLGGALVEAEGGGAEALAEVEVGQLQAGPLLVGVDVEVVPLAHLQAARGEELARNACLDVCLLALCVVCAAGEKVARDQLEDTPLFAAQVRRSTYGVDGRVRLVVLAAPPRRPEAAIQQARRKAAPPPVRRLLGYQLAQVLLALVEAVRLRARVADQAALVELLRHPH